MDGRAVRQGRLSNRFVALQVLPGAAWRALGGTGKPCEVARVREREREIEKD